MRAAFIFILLIHGIIHLIGFLKAYQVAEMEQLTLPISRIAGVFWLLASLLFIASAIAYLLQLEWWWMLAGVAVIISQALIVNSWEDAKFGTIANIIILALSLVAYGNWSFRSMVRGELDRFWKDIPTESEVIGNEHIKPLPLVVRQWLKNSGVIQNEQIRTIHFSQSGRMKTEPGSNWLPVEAEQFIKVHEPGFIWIADVRAAPYIHLSGRDKYLDGHGHMLIKLLSLIPVADSKGPKIDQGTLLRYLAEMIWYPTAALEEYISWKEVNDSSARANMTYGGITGSGIFGFNEQGDVVSFEAQRYYDRKNGATLETWIISIDEESYQTVGGIRIPTRAEVTWKLSEGDFTWYQLKIDDIIFNGRASSY